MNKEDDELLLQLKQLEDACKRVCWQVYRAKILYRGQAIAPEEVPNHINFKAVYQIIATIISSK